MEPKPISLDEHSLIGLELCAMRERLRILAMRIDAGYGRSVGCAGRTAAAVDAFRDVLTSRVMESCPPAYVGPVAGVYHCTERLQALREERDLKVIGDRLLGIAEGDLGRNSRR